MSVPGRGAGLRDEALVWGCWWAPIPQPASERVPPLVAWGVLWGRATSCPSPEAMLRPWGGGSDTFGAVVLP